MFDFDDEKTYMIYNPSRVLYGNFVAPSYTWVNSTSSGEWKHYTVSGEMMNNSELIKEGELPKMNVYNRVQEKTLSREYVVNCNNAPDLSQERILKNISILKSKLMMECSPLFIKNIECKMTPNVKENIIKAWRRLNMYGKETPFVARFDEYGRRLPDVVKIDTLQGMTIKIVDPKDYGECYLEFRCILPEEFEVKKYDF